MNVKNVLILAGGKGTRMRENTESIPKPMVEIGGLPVLVHIINHFRTFGNFKFFVLTGYKEEVIFQYFKDNIHNDISLVPTGLETNTGGRIKKAQEFIDGNFFMTYGDGLSDIDISEIDTFHSQHNKIATISVNKPVSRFGLVDFDEDGKVNAFIEKPILNSYVNMGYMILNPSVFGYLNEDIPFETNPLKQLAEDSEIYAYKHTGFFRPMDTHREYLELNKMWDDGIAPWKK